MTIEEYFNTPSVDAKNILLLLKEKHNVLISGPPATGKTRLLAEIRHWFSQAPTPKFIPNGPSPFPANQAGHEIIDVLPSPEKEKRKVFPITFHQGTKYRDFITGLAPDPTASTAKFLVTTGVLYKAAMHADSENSTSLLVIDEINRGPAVAIFGDAINAIETDKRKKPDGTISDMTWTFPLLMQDGGYSEISFSHHLYILAAMNQADTSVEPLDVAFLRRFEPYELSPNENVVRTLFKIESEHASELPDNPSEAKHILEALTRAWTEINRLISIARGSEFEIGHGVMMDIDPTKVGTDLEYAKVFALKVWKRLYAHISEVFFGDTLGLASILKADQAGSLFSIEYVDFADSSIANLQGKNNVTKDNIYKLLINISKNG